jgi:hypothetical protein
VAGRSLTRRPHRQTRGAVAKAGERECGQFALRSVVVTQPGQEIRQKVLAEVLLLMRLEVKPTPKTASDSVCHRMERMQLGDGERRHGGSGWSLLTSAGCRNVIPTGVGA